jgi:hypothetical protein
MIENPDLFDFTPISTEKMLQKVPIAGTRLKNSSRRLKVFYDRSSQFNGSLDTVVGDIIFD